jgi:ABC-type bacteriocin/lantibiotic exporter with double-glycine peptidase domain
MAHRPGLPGLALLIALASCRAAPTEPALLSESAVTLDLPLVRQDELHTCGLAAIAALCQYWGVEIPAEQRAELARRAAAEEGLSGGELREALEAAGMEAFLFRGSLDRSETGLYRHIDAGRPLVVMLAPDEKSHHYCLVLGYDEPRENVVLLDPARGEVLRPLKAFASAWERCQRFTLLACPKAGGEDLPSGSNPDYRGQNPSKEK